MRLTGEILCFLQGTYVYNSLYTYINTSRASCVNCTHIAIDIAYEQLIQHQPVVHTLTRREDSHTRTYSHGADKALFMPHALLASWLHTSFFMYTLLAML